MTAYILDTETTGADEGDEVIELAYASISSDWQIDQLYCERFEPEVRMKWDAIATHHILPEDLFAQGLRGSGYAKIPDDATYLIGHRIDFDWKMLGSPRNVKLIDTLAFYRSKFPEADSHKLGALMYFVFGATKETKARLQSAHSAAHDILFAWDLLKYYMSLYPDVKWTMEKLWVECEHARIPKIMAFGKYKGQPVSAVDRGWVSWYRRQDDTDPYLLRAFELAGK